VFCSARSVSFRLCGRGDFTFAKTRRGSAVAMGKLLRRLALFRRLLGNMSVFYSNRDLLFPSTAGPYWEAEFKRRLESEIYLERYGFKVYSQNDEDGIIHEIFRRIGLKHKTFIEFGVMDGLECNTHFLLHMGWKGLWLEGSKQYYEAIQKNFSSVIQSGRLKTAHTFITRENINETFAENGFSGEIDLLSIDIDGNDYHVFEAISAVNPRVVVIEYNAKFPPFCSWAMPYDARHVWDGSDRFGASLKALEELGDRKNYQLVGTNCNGINAFFVRKDLAENLFASTPTAENLYNPMRPVFYKNGHPAKTFLDNMFS
jgi:hypothetical protein